MKNFNNDLFHNEIQNIKNQNMNIREDINDLVVMTKEEANDMLDNIKQNLKNMHQNIKNIKMED